MLHVLHARLFTAAVGAIHSAAWRRGTLLAILAISLGVGTALRVAGIAGRRIVTHDEAISFLAATGHEGEFARITSNVEYPAGTWAPVREWKRLIQPERAFCFATVGSDLTHHDIHPPLYFWLLHAWVLAWGPSLAAGLALNTLLGLAAFAGVFALTRRLLRDSLTAAIVAAAWYLSPSVMAASVDARQYALLTLCTVSCAFAMANLLEVNRRPRRREYALLTVSAAAGLLTQYYFAIILGGVLVAACLAMFRRDPARLNRVLGCLLAGVLIFVLLHPGFAESFRHAADNTSRSDMPLRDRAAALALAAMKFFLHWMGLLHLQIQWHLRRPWFIAGGIVAVVALACVRIFKRPDALATAAAVRYRFMVFMLAWTGGSLAVLSLAGITPAHATGGKYFSMLWMFVAFVVGLAIHRLRLAARMLAIPLLLILLVTGSVQFAYHDCIARPPRDAATLATSGERIVLDCTRRGVLPVLLWNVPDDTLVFAAEPDVLLAREKELLAGMTGPAVYLSVPPAGTVEPDAQVAAMLAKHRQVADAGRDYSGVAAAYRVMPSSALAPRSATSEFNR